jgi:ubiquitin carboxyl-terminal hydrolase 9/13
MPERKPSLHVTPSEHPESANTPPGYIIPSTPPSLFSALRSLFAFISFHPSQKGTIAPRAFIEKLKEINEVFRSNMHQDAHEFLNYLLNKIVEEIEEERRQTRQNGEDCELSVYCGLHRHN